MKYLRLFPVVLAGLFALSLPTIAQEPVPENQPEDQRSEGRRPNLFAELGLTPEQVQQIRRINQQRRPRMMEAQRRLRVANRELDAAIYRDVVSEEEFQSKLKELQAAQADVARLRFESELSIRRILSQEQLVRFRELRQKFAQERQENGPFRPNRRGRGDLPPFRQMRNRGVPKND
jgi:Spy/CpxP family protein refolding chaperone